MIDSWYRTVIEPFKASNWFLKVGDEVEFLGQLDSRPGEVLIGVANGIAVWAASSDVAKKTKGRGKYLPSRNVVVTKGS